MLHARKADRVLDALAPREPIEHVARTGLRDAAAREAIEGSGPFREGGWRGSAMQPFRRRLPMRPEDIAGRCDPILGEVPSETPGRRPVTAMEGGHAPGLHGDFALAPGLCGALREAANDNVLSTSSGSI